MQPWHSQWHVCLLFTILLSGCSWINSTNKKDEINILSLLKVNPQFQAKVIWKHVVGKGTGRYYSTLHPSYQGDYIFAADRNGIIKALDANTGKAIWSVDLSIHTRSPSRNYPALLSGGVTATATQIYVGSERAKIYALNSKNGKINWETTVEGEVLSSPSVSHGMVLVHTSNGMLQALNEIDGLNQWTINLYISPFTFRRESSPSVAFGIVLVGGDDGRISATLIHRGRLLWQQRISQIIGATDIARLDGVQTTPVVVDHIVYALSYNGNLVALNLYSGKIIWSRKIGSITNFLVERGHIYLVDKYDKVIACNAKTGMTLWCQSGLLHHHLTAPTLYNSYIVIGDAKGYLYWINPDNGIFVYCKKIDQSGFLSKPIVADDKLIVQSKNGKVYALIM